MKRRAWHVAAVAALVAASACGSTVPQSQVAGGGGEFGESGDVGGSGDMAFGTEVGPGSTGSSTVTGGTRTGAGPVGPGGTSSTTIGGGVSGDGRRDFSRLPMGKGVTATKILLGFSWADRDALQGKVNEVGGATGRSFDNQRDAAQAVIDYINKNGGIAGRTVTPVWFQTDENVATPEGRAQNAQRACATFTEDNKVFAFAGLVTFTEDNILECARRSRTPYIDVIPHGGNWVDEQRFGETAPYYYKLTGLLADRAERTLINSLVRQQFFTPSARVGLLVFDRPAIIRGVDRAIKPALKKLGVEIVDEIRYPDIINSGWDTYAFQFKQKNVTHVIFSSSPGASHYESLLFMRAAQTQRTDSFHYGGAHSGAMGNPEAPVEQRRKAMGVMWNPSWLRAGTEAFPPVSKNDEVCRKIMRDKGFSDVIGNYSGFEYCDFLFFLKQALEGADALTPEGLKASVARLGTAWQSAGLAFNGATDFLAPRTDGVALVRDVRWNEQSSRHEYVGDPYPAAR